MTRHSNITTAIAGLCALGCLASTFLGCGSSHSSDAGDVAPPTPDATDGADAADAADAADDATARLPPPPPCEGEPWARTDYETMGVGLGPLAASASTVTWLSRPGVTVHRLDRATGEISSVQIETDTLDYEREVFFEAGVFVAVYQTTAAPALVGKRLLFIEEGLDGAVDEIVVDADWSGSSLVGGHVPGRVLLGEFARGIFDGRITELDVNTREIVRSVPLPDDMRGGVQLAITPTHYLVAPGSGPVRLLDPSTLELLPAPMDIESGFRPVENDLAIVYRSDDTEMRVSRSISDLSLLGAIEELGGPGGPAVAGYGHWFLFVMENRYASEYTVPNSGDAVIRNANLEVVHDLGSLGGQGLFYVAPTPSGFAVSADTDTRVGLSIFEQCGETP